MPTPPSHADASVDPFAARLAVGALLLAGALAFGLCLWQFMRDNAAPAIDLAGYPTDPSRRDAHELDRCERTPAKLVVQGWVATPPERGQARQVRVVVAQDGHWRALATRLHDLDDVGSRAAARTDVPGDYRYSGFAASIDLVQAGIEGELDALALALDSRAGSSLVALACPGVAP